jgi:hypothetical protein
MNQNKQIGSPLSSKAKTVVSHHSQRRLPHLAETSNDVDEVIRSKEVNVAFDMSPSLC